MGKTKIRNKKGTNSNSSSNVLSEQLNLWDIGSLTAKGHKETIKSIGVLSLKCVKVREIEDSKEISQVSNLNNNDSIENSLSGSDAQIQTPQDYSIVNELETKKYPYVKQVSLLTAAEKVLYRFLLDRLHKINQDLVLLSKVRIADILKMADGFSSRSGAFYKIAYKHIDFVILDLNLDIICTVELDDFTHTWKRRAERDAFVDAIMKDCGVPLFRVKRKVAELSDVDTYPIEMCVLEHIAPRCPVCGRPMEVKTSRYSRNYGHRFYGCMGFYESGLNRCNFTIDIDI